MSPLAKPSLRLSAASVASGLSKKDIRNWLDRGILHLFSEQEHGWTEFSHADIAMLALAEKLTSVSVPAAQACRIARALIEDTGLTAGRVALPALALSGAFTLKAVMVRPEAGDLRRFRHHRQFLKFCGMDLATVQSGLFRGRSKISKYGNARLRRTLWLASQAAS